MHHRRVQFQRDCPAWSSLCSFTHQRPRCRQGSDQSFACHCCIPVLRFGGHDIERNDTRSRTTSGWRRHYALLLLRCGIADQLCVRISASYAARWALDGHRYCTKLVGVSSTMGNTSADGVQAYYNRGGIYILNILGCISEQGSRKGRKECRVKSTKVR